MQFRDKKIGLVVGVFDLFHVGHVRLLARARAMVDELVVVVNGDRMTRAYKRDPIMTELERCEVVSTSKFVDHCVISNTFEVADHIGKYGITHIIHGDDWSHAAYLKQIRLSERDIGELGLSMVYLPYTKEVSTTDLMRRCAERSKDSVRSASML